MPSMQLLDVYFIPLVASVAHSIRPFIRTAFPTFLSRFGSSILETSSVHVNARTLAVGTVIRLLVQLL